MQKDISCLIQQSGSTWITTAYAMDNNISIEELKALASNGSIVEEDGMFTLKKYQDIENQIASNIFRLLYFNEIEKVPEAIIRKHIGDYEKKEKIELHDLQKKAIIASVNNAISILCGGPGTGKTSVVKGMIYVLNKLFPRKKIAIAAPTGKAAKRISESTDAEASTVHKLLSITPDQTNDIQELKDEILIIDECSFLDCELFLNVLSALKSNRRLILIGDTNQLPSVAPGSILRDLIKSNYITTTLLTKTFRQSNESVLYENIQNIKNGLNTILTGEDFKTCKCDESMDYREKAKLIREQYKCMVDIYGIQNVALLVPYRKKGICSNKLNNYIQPLINHQKQGFRFYNQNDNNTLFFCQNDLVMQTVNREECVNGEIGIIKEVNSTGVYVSFDDTSVHYDVNSLNELALSYALSINKSQGSEYKAVIIALLNEHERMFSKNLLYTAVSRGKKHVTLIYDQNALDQSLAKNIDDLRTTRLVNKLDYMRNKYRYVYGI